MSRQELQPATLADSPRILLVEADPRFALLLTQMLRAFWSERLVLVHAETAADAAQELTDHGAGCVLLALDSTDDEPLATLAELRVAAPAAAILALCDHHNEQLALAALRAGAEDFLVKPEIHPAQLRRAIVYALERKRGEVELAQRALHDSLTGLPNRALFLDRLGVALDRARRTGNALAVLFLDVDNFKEINDGFGHAAGDAVLTTLAHRLRGMMRPMDTIARFGGDEFTLLCEELTDEREVVFVAERIAQAAQVPVRLDDGEVPVSVSVGVSTVVDPGTPPELVIREADTAMYRAKELGRGRYELFNEVSRARAMERIELESALSHAVDREELRVHYQPRVSLRGELGVIGFEALVRWQHPERGLIPPADFLPLAEETGTVLRIGEFVLGEALREVGRWRTLRPSIRVSVNLSGRQLEDAGLVKMLAAQLRDSEVDPGALCLEVSEAAVRRNWEAAGETLRGLRSLGIGIVLDDYGTGTAPLSDLRRLPIDAVKIHETFVEELRHPEHAAVVSALVDLGHALGLQVAAEGVETDVQLAQLRAVGCDDAQGYFLGAPVPSQEVEQLLEPAPN